MSQLLTILQPLPSRVGISAQLGRAAPSTAVCSLKGRRPRSQQITAFLPQELSDQLSDVFKPANRNQLAIGSAVGFATGYAIKRVGQVLLVFIGLEIIALQLMANQGWVIVNWPLISKDLSPHVEKGAFDRVIDALKLKLPFGGSFTAGCYAGFNWS